MGRQVLLISLISWLLITPARAEPLTGLVGQQASVCQVGQELIGIVVSADTYTDVAGKASEGLWVVATVTVTNQGTQPVMPWLVFGLQDSRGRLFKAFMHRGAIDNADITFALGGASTVEEVQPGVPSKKMFVWEVASDAEGLMLVPTPWNC